MGIRFLWMQTGWWRNRIAMRRLKKSLYWGLFVVMVLIVAWGRLPFAKAVARHEIQARKLDIMFLASLAPLQPLVSRAMDDPIHSVGALSSYIHDMTTDILPRAMAIAHDVTPHDPTTQRIKDDVLLHIQYMEDQFKPFNQISQGLSLKHGWRSFLNASVLAINTMDRSKEIVEDLEKNNQKIMTSLHDYVNGLLNVPDRYGGLIAVLFEGERRALYAFVTNMIIDMASENESFRILYEDGTFRDGVDKWVGHQLEARRSKWG